jgi:hypothetical protein
MKILFIATGVIISSVAVFKVDNSIFNFGRIKQNQSVSHSFKISNNGKIPLLIYSVSTTCGCTTTHFPKMIKPYATGLITVKFDSKGIRGTVIKNIVVITNTKEEYHKLTIKGTVD